MTPQARLARAKVTQLVGIIFTLIALVTAVFDGPNLFWLALTGLVLITSALSQRLDLLEKK